MRSRRRTWAIVLDAVVVLPLLGALLSSPGDHRATANLCTGLGMLAASLTVVSVLVVSRVRGLTRWLGLELGNDLHRRLGPAVAVATLGHVVTAVLGSPRGLALLDPVTTTRPIKAGVIAALAMLLTAFLVVPRRHVRHYGRLVRVHGLLAVLTVVYTGIHVAEVGHWIDAPLLGLAWLSIGTLVASVLAWRWLLRPLFNHGAYTLGAVRRETTSTVTLVLDPVEGQQPRPAEPGQFVWLRRHRVVGIGEEHPFSVAASTRSGILELTVRVRGTFTRDLLASPAGTKVWLDGPHGSFVPSSPWPTPEQPHSHAGGLVLIAGGVGITPMMSILRAHAAGGDPRPHRLLLAERPDERLFGPELGFLERHLDLRVRRTAGRRLDRAFLVESLPADHRDDDHFVCGPAGLVITVLEALEALGVPGERIHTERFD